MVVWTWLVGRVGQKLAGAIGIGIIMVLLAGAGTFIVSWIRAGNNAEWLRSINQATAEANAKSNKAAQAEREKAEADKAAALERVRDLENQLQKLKDDPVCFPKAIARSLNR